MYMYTYKLNLLVTILLLHRRTATHTIGSLWCVISCLNSKAGSDCFRISLNMYPEHIWIHMLWQSNSLIYIQIHIHISASWFCWYPGSTCNGLSKRNNTYLLYSFCNVDFDWTSRYYWRLFRQQNPNHFPRKLRISTDVVTLR